MKNLYYFLFFIAQFIFHSQLQAQQLENHFKILNGKDLIWQKVYNEKVSPEKLIIYLTKFEQSELLSKADSSFSIKVLKLKPDNEGMGYNSWNSLTALNDVYLTGFAKVEFQKDRYRITFQNIELYRSKSLLSSNSGTYNPINNSAIKNGAFTKYFETKKYSGVLNYTLDNFFQYTDLKEDSW